ncbi:O-methyltransferase [Methylosinus sp. Sm6]|uniref:O-methyltransferase n=1 Tax=Methylosinus sp. Sm6 TaxID=2866948 RepID=UPI001C9902C7|nr:class I SAM-dependent methyltransferase [Methylosinus sp. Sm6]MBY6242507.1 class I SAM-dependent methyltransferase [Methylosinus sp. Sm6]
MISLHSTAVSTTLDRLYREAELQDPDLRRRARAECEARGTPFDDRAVASLLDSAFIGVAPEVGRLLYQLVRLRRPERVVEFGTSFGLSAIHIAAALADNGRGRLIATEIDAQKAERATQHLREAGLETWAEVRPGDPFETLVGVERIDLLLLDGWKALYLPMLRALEPALGEGALVIADDLKIMPEMLAPYLAYVRDPANGYSSGEIPLDDGLELSLRG